MRRRATKAAASRSDGTAMQHTKHLWRAALLVIGFGLVFVLGSHFMVPATFGDEGFYRAASRAEYMAQPAVHGADRHACASCHEKQQATHDQGRHASVNCEVCHAPMATHVRDGQKFADMVKNPSRALCGRCHQKLAARPKAFPQIEPAAHLQALGAIEAGEPVPDGSCALCHPAHDPKQS